jgi:hypothetical protein
MTLLHTMLQVRCLDHAAIIIATHTTIATIPTAAPTSSDIAAGLCAHQRAPPGPRAVPRRGHFYNPGIPTNFSIAPARNRPVDDRERAAPGAAVRCRVRPTPFTPPHPLPLPPLLLSCHVPASLCLRIHACNTQPTGTACGGS